VGGWPLLERLGRVDHNDVEALVGSLQPTPGVLESKLDPRVVEAGAMELGEMPATGLDHLGVDVHHQGPPDRGVPENLAERGAFTPADHHHALRGRVGQHRGVDQPLVVNELVPDRGLDPAVQGQGHAVAQGFKDL